MENTAQKQFDSLTQASTLPREVVKAFEARGFVNVNDFFVAGIGSIAFDGAYRLTIPGATKNSIILTSSSVEGTMEQAYASNSYGDGTTQYDITNPAGTTFRYTYDGTGTNPNINLTTLPIGSQVTIFGNFNSNNQGTFTTTGAGSNYFEINNPIPGVVESNKTGFVVGGPLTSSYGILVTGVATTQFYFVVFLFDKLYVNDSL